MILWLCILSWGVWWGELGGSEEGWWLLVCFGCVELGDNSGWWRWAVGERTDGRASSWWGLLGGRESKVDGVWKEAEHSTSVYVL